MKKRPSDLTIEELTKFGSEAVAYAAEKAKKHGVILTGRNPTEYGEAKIIVDDETHKHTVSSGRKVAS
jgi:hypothetical protein